MKFFNEVLLAITKRLPGVKVTKAGKRLTLTAASVIVFVTVYFMVLPAITLTTDVAEEMPGITLNSSAYDTEEWELADLDEVLADPESGVALADSEVLSGEPEGLLADEAELLPAMEEEESLNTNTIQQEELLADIENVTSYDVEVTVEALAETLLPVEFTVEELQDGLYRDEAEEYLA